MKIRRSSTLLLLLFVVLMATAGVAFVQRAWQKTAPVRNGSILQLNEFITIQSSRVSELPEGVRVFPSQLALFAKLQSTTNGKE